MLYYIGTSDMQVKPIDPERNEIRKAKNDLGLAIYNEFVNIADSLSLVPDLSDNEKTDKVVDNVMLSLFLLSLALLGKSYMSGVKEALKQLSYSQVDRVWYSEKESSKQYIFKKEVSETSQESQNVDVVTVSDSAIVKPIIGDVEHKKPLEINTESATRNGLAISDSAHDWASGRSASLLGRVLVDGELEVSESAEMSIARTTKEGIRKIIDKSVASGMSIEEIVSYLRSSEILSLQRAKVIADVETRNADISGVQKIYSDSGVVEKKKWLTRRDSRVDAVCLVNEAAGAIPVDSLFPSGHMHPLAHPRCRCKIIPVIS